MPASLRPLSTGELLDKTFALYRQNFPVFRGIAALPYLALSACQLLLIGASRGSSVGAALFVSLAGIALVIGLFVAEGLSHAGTTYAVSALALDRPVTIGQSYSQVRGRLWVAIAVSLLFSFALGIGIVLLIVPGILVLAKYSLGVPVAVLERQGIRKSFERSKQLSQGSGGRILLVYVLLFALMLAISMGLGAVLGLIPVLRNTAWLEVVLRFVVNVLAAPFLTIALTLLYYDQRVRKEAFDIEHMMSTLQSAEPSESAAAAGVTA